MQKRLSVCELSLDAKIFERYEKRFLGLFLLVVLFVCSEFLTFIINSRLEQHEVKYCLSGHRLPKAHRG
jgi:hypothetical protein